MFSILRRSLRLDDKFKFSDINFESDLEKEIEFEVEEDKHFKKESDLYDYLLYTVVSREHNINLGIFPSDQNLASTSVLLWNNIFTIPTFLKNSDYKVVQIRLTPSIIREYLRNLGGGVYAIKYVPNTLSMSEVNV